MTSSTLIPPSAPENPWSPSEPPVFAYAGFMDRMVALVIDQILLYIAKFALFFPLVMVAAVGPVIVGPQISAYGAFAGLSPTFWALSVVIDWLYFAGMESSARGATLGKRAMNLRVTDVHGGRISFVRASVRYVSKILSYIPLMLGFVMMLFTPRKQALHDLIASTLVLDVKAK